jgi:hypothetical protein
MIVDCYDPVNLFEMVPKLNVFGTVILAPLRPSFPEPELPSRGVFVTSWVMNYRKSVYGFLHIGGPINPGSPL